MKKIFLFYFAAALLASCAPDKSPALIQAERDFDSIKRRNDSIFYDTNFNFSNVKIYKSKK